LTVVVEIARASGADHVPRWTSPACDLSHAFASSFLSKVTGAGRMTPSSPRNRACQRPEESCLVVPAPAILRRVPAILLPLSQ